MTMLTWLADTLRKAGLNVVEEPGWETRGRGEMGTVKGVICHHTGGPLTGDHPSLRVVKDGRNDLPGPLSQLFLARDGTWHIVAAGRCNHAGKGVWQGVTNGNTQFIGVEAENAGTGSDPWPRVQLNAYIKGVAAILRYLHEDSVWAVGHKEYALPKGRKTDPSFDMIAFREQVEHELQPGKSVPPLPVASDPRRSMLRKGDQNDSVKLLQRLLKITQDGNFGPMTEKAVKAFQEQHGLKADGLVGPKTWAELGE